MPGFWPSKGDVPFRVTVNTAIVAGDPNKQPIQSLRFASQMYVCGCEQIYIYIKGKRGRASERVSNRREWKVEGR